jgi:hypothetical protein
VGLTNPNIKNKLVTKDQKKPRIWTDPLDKLHKRKKMDIIFGTWNVRRLYTAGSLTAVAEEISKYKFGFVGVRKH